MTTCGCIGSGTCPISSLHLRMKSAVYLHFSWFKFVSVIVSVACLFEQDRVVIFWNAKKLFHFIDWSNFSLVFKKIYFFEESNLKKRNCSNKETKKIFIKVQGKPKNAMNESYIKLVYLFFSDVTNISCAISWTDKKSARWRMKNAAFWSFSTQFYMGNKVYLRCW